jgi:hypothetical protein
MIFDLKQLALTPVPDAAGQWWFEGGQVLSPPGAHVANYACVRRVIPPGTNQNGQHTSMVTTTLFFLPAVPGNPPENITLQGANDFPSGNEIGSVSAASPAWAAHIGKPYKRTGIVLDIV